MSLRARPQHSQVLWNDAIIGATPELSPCVRATPSPSTDSLWPHAEACCSAPFYFPCNSRLSSTTSSTCTHAGRLEPPKNLHQGRTPLNSLNPSLDRSLSLFSFCNFKMHTSRRLRPDARTPDGWNAQGNAEEAQLPIEKVFASVLSLC